MSANQIQPSPPTRAQRLIGAAHTCGCPLCVALVRAVTDVQPEDTSGVPAKHRAYLEDGFVTAMNAVETAMARVLGVRL